MFGVFNTFIILIVLIVYVLVCIFVSVDGYQDVKKYPWTPWDGNMPYGGATGGLAPPQGMPMDSKVLQTNDLLTKFGVPTNDFVYEENFIISYDRAKKIPHWVLEHLTPDSVRKKEELKRKTHFKNHTSIPDLFCPQPSDYKNSGYDKGHIAAAANHRDTQANHTATNVYQNAAPQIGPGFNRAGGVWYRLEEHNRNQLLNKEYAEMYIISVSLFLPLNGKNYVKYRVIGENNVAVPTHFGEVTLGVTADGALDMTAYIIPHQAYPKKTPLTDFMVHPRQVEQSGGLLIFHQVDRSKLRKLNGVLVHPTEVPTVQEHELAGTNATQVPFTPVPTPVDVPLQLRTTNHLLGDVINLILTDVKKLCI